MSFVMLALMVALAASTVIVLADSGLRLWFALGGIKAERMAIQTGAVDRLRLPKRATVRTTTRVSYARAGATNALLRAAA